MTARRVNLKKILETDDRAAIKHYCRMILDGALFVYPTDTIYGIGGIISEAIERRIYSVKNRSEELPLLVVGNSLDIVKRSGALFNDSSLAVANRFWPDSVTLILNNSFSDKTIGVRVSSHPFLKMISEFIDLPIFSTSANISGEEYLGNPDVIYDTFKNSIDLFFDYGDLPHSKSSTILNLTNELRPTLHREGVVSKDVLAKFFEKLFTK